MSRCNAAGRRSISAKHNTENGKGVSAAPTITKSYTSTKKEELLQVINKVKQQLENVSIYHLVYSIVNRFAAVFFVLNTHCFDADILCSSRFFTYVFYCVAYCFGVCLGHHSTLLNVKSTPIRT